MNLSNLLGANWRTTVFGTLAVTCAYIAANPALLAFLPPEVAKAVFGAAALISGIITSYHMKDKQVSGNGTPDDPQRVPGPDGRSVPVSVLLLFLLPASLVLAGCADMTAAQKTALTNTDKVVVAGAINAGLTLWGDMAASGKANPGEIISSGISGATVQLRSLEGTAAASDPAAIGSAIDSGSTSQQLAGALKPLVISGVQSAISAGYAPSGAVEKVSADLDATAATIKTAKPPASLFHARLDTSKLCLKTERRWSEDGWDDISGPQVVLNGNVLR